MNREELIEEAAKAIGEVTYTTHNDQVRAARAALAVFEKAHAATDSIRKLARAMARVEQLSDHLGIPYVYETGLDTVPTPQSEPSDAELLAAANSYMRYNPPYGHLSAFSDQFLGDLRAALRAAGGVR